MMSRLIWVIAAELGLQLENNNQPISHYLIGFILVFVLHPKTNLKNFMKR